MLSDKEKPVRQLIGLMDALHCGAALVDRAGRIRHANPRLCTMIGLPLGDLAGKDFYDLYPSPQDRAYIDQRLQHFDETYEGEFYLPRTDGDRVPIIVSGRPLDCGGATASLRLLTIMDITRQKQAEERATEQYQTIATLSDTILEQALDLKHDKEHLEQRVRERTAELHEANMEAIYMLAVASEAKDGDTGAHVRRIQHYAQALAREMGLAAPDAEQMGYSAILHDVGKMSVPDHILKKPGPLTDDERREMERHTVVGESILSLKPFFAQARDIARGHHENWDGSGYPDGRAGHAIPLAARIVHVADVYDALTHPRVYKPAWSVERAAGEIAAGGGTSFDPEVVRAFDALIGSARLLPDSR
ncbi:MAG: HD domain-containing protein [Acidobacteria bacterium]|nr:HD domain-containing protein [Acidobacteriota bacterium]MBM3809562.1 HD domain-containing protein [Acidimicrobiia bacterium]